MARCEEYVSRYSVCKNCNNEAVDCGKEKCPVYKSPTADVIPKAKVEEVLQQINTLIIEYLDGLYTAGEFMEIFTELKKRYTEELK